MEKNNEQAVYLSLSEILRIIRHRLWFIGLIVLVFLAGAFLYNETQVPLYQARLKMSISSSKQDVGLPSQSYEYQDYYSRHARMQTHLAVIRSTDVVRKLLDNPEIQQLLLEEQKGTTQSGSFISNLKDKIVMFISPTLQTEEPQQIDEAERRQGIVARLQGSIQVAIIPETNLIEIMTIDPNPRMAATIANGLAAAYRDYMLNKKMEGVRENISWMTSEIQKLRTDIREARGSIEEVSAEENILAIEQNPEFLQSELGRMRAELNTTQTTRAQVDAEVNELDKILKSTLKYVPAFLDSEVLREINVKLVGARLELQSLSKTYKEKHPKMIQKQAEVSFLADQFNQELQKALYGQKSQQNIIKAKEASLLSMIDQYRLQSTVKGKQGTELTLLQSEVESNEELYKILLGQMKSANITETLLSETIEVIEPAKLPLFPFSPRKMLNLMLSLILGTFVATVLAILIEFAEARISTQEDVEKYLQVRFLGSLPKVKAEESLHLETSHI